MKMSFFRFYTTDRKARLSAYAAFAFLAFCYIAINNLLFHRPERDVSYEVIGLLAVMVATAPVVYHFVTKEREKRLVQRLADEVAQVGQEVAQMIEHARKEQNQPLRLLLADDQETTAMLRTLSKERGLEVVAEASDGREALEKAISLKPDVVVLDMQMPGSISGIEVAREISRTLSNTKVLLLGRAYSPAIKRKALEAGAFAYLERLPLFNIIKPLLGAMEAIRHNKTVSDSTVPSIAAEKISRFTPRQLEIVKLIAMGNRTVEIALTLGIREDEVESERLRIMEELTLFSAGDAVLSTDRDKVAS